MLLTASACVHRLVLKECVNPRGLFFDFAKNATNTWLDGKSSTLTPYRRPLRVQDRLFAAAHPSNSGNRSGQLPSQRSQKKGSARPLNRSLSEADSKPAVPVKF